MANQNIPAIQVKESNVGIGTVSPLNKLSVSEGSFNLNATQASILNTNYGQKGHVVYDTLLIQQDDAPTIRLYMWTITSLWTTDELRLVSHSCGWVHLLCVTE
jgi:hypothetical protein